jgi:ribosome-associated toxin RatA of RatAB toxin-antitoxin module
MKKISGLITGLSFLLIASASSALALEGADLVKFNAGQPVVRTVVDKDTSKTETQLVFLVKSSPDKIWNTLMDFDNYPQFMPVKEIKLKNRTKNVDILFIRPEAPPFFDVSYDLKRTYYKNDWKIVFTKAGGKIKSIDGYWKFDPIDAKSTKVTYVSNVDIGITVPGFVKDYFTKGSLYKMADAVKKRVESNGKWKK